MRRLILCFIFFYSSTLLFAQQADSALIRLYKDLTLEDLMEIEVTSVSKISESLSKAPQSIIVLQAETLKQRGYTDLEQVFHDLPGFDISRGYGTEYSQIYQRGYRSNNTDRTLVLVDGVEVNDLWSNSAWISRQHALSNIDRIEIIYGPSSTMYGANAFAGVVSIITKDNAAFLEDNAFGVTGEVGGGTWNTYFADVTAAGKYKDASIQITGRYYFSDEMDLSNYEDWDYNLSKYDEDYYSELLGTNDPDLIAEAMSLDQQFYYNDPILNSKPEYSNTTKDWYLNGKMNVKGFEFGFQTYEISEGYGGWYRDDFELGPKHGGTWGPNNTHLYARYDGEITDKLSFSSFTRFKVHKLTGHNNEEYFYAGYFNGMLGLNNLMQQPDTVITYNNDLNQLDTTINYLNKNPEWQRTFYHAYSQQLRTELKIFYKPSEKLNIIGGLEYRQSHIQGQYVVSTNKDAEDHALPLMIDGGNHFYSTDIGIFSQIRYTPFDNLSLIGGGRLDHNTIRISGGYGYVFNPKVAVIFSPADFIFKGIYSEAFKDAGFWTKYGTTPGRLLNNPTLQPERVQNTEFSAAWQINENLLVDVNFYNSVYSDVIGTAQVDYVNEAGDTINTTQHQPVGSLDIKGLMSNINYKYKNYSLYLNYTYTLPYNTQKGEHIRIGDIASHQINAGVNAQFFSKLNVNLRTNWVGEKPTGAETTISTNPLNKIDPYFVLNGAISYNFYKEMTVQLVANNILNEKYYHPGVRSANGSYYASRIPQYERHLFLKLYVNF